MIICTHPNRKQINSKQMRWSGCSNCYGRMWRKSTPERLAEHHRLKAGTQRKAKLRKYGLTAESYQAMIDAQGGRCAICDEVPEARRKATKHVDASRPFDVDHDHATGQVRGLLCGRCNSRLLPAVEHYGHLVGRAAAYLRGWVK